MTEKGVIARQTSQTSGDAGGIIAEYEEFLCGSPAKEGFIHDPDQRIRSRITIRTAGTKEESPEGPEGAGPFSFPGKTGEGAFKSLVEFMEQLKKTERKSQILAAAGKLQELHFNRGKAMKGAEK